jgi:hypothetical protein
MIKWNNALKITADSHTYAKDRYRINDQPHFVGIYRVKRLESMELFK